MKFARIVDTEALNRPFGSQAVSVVNGDGTVFEVYVVPDDFTLPDDLTWQELLLPADGWIYDGVPDTVEQRWTYTVANNTFHPPT